MKRLLLLPLLFLSCSAHQPAAPADVPQKMQCRTICGMTADLTSGEECEGLLLAEQEILDAFQKRVRWFDRQAACIQLKGWKAIRHEYVLQDNNCPDVHWLVQGICVVGYTEERTMEVLPTIPWEKSSLPHEMAHALFGYAHCGWKERGIKKALKDVDGEWDTSADECAPPKKHKKK